MTTDNEKGPLNQMESGQEKRSASEARALSEIVNGTPSENLCRRGSPATEQASETTAQQPRTYTTQPAESVMGIALRQCGNEMEWRHILACNPEFAHMLPHEYFPVGTVLNLPPHPAAASPVEQPEKSLAPEGGSEARGRWIQANCPTGDIIESPSPSNNREFPTSMSESDCEHRIALAPSQPAAAAIENAELASVTRMFHAACADLGLINEALGLDPEDGGAAPILEAIEELKARAASANETGAEGAMEDHECVYENGDGTCRQCAELAKLAKKRFGYARKIDYRITGQEPDDHELCSSDAPGAFPLYRSPAMVAEPVAIHAGWKLVRVNEHFDALIAALERAESKGYLPDAVREEWENFACDENVPQPAQADARVGLTDEQRDVLTWAIGRANSQGEDACADVLRSILASQPGRPVPRAEVTDAARAGEAS
ncbi:hypothetical protein [Burkholderia vietnamiensis]|uniref:hypothetical protein n=1 Tax=Burkholderia vietnamiensis TaxID=60552 RepID=UPI001FC8C41B|nr:hypothetical protein [Burkholderia vietnamiensis]